MSNGNRLTRRSDVFAQALRAYEAQDYAEAIRISQALLATNPYLLHPYRMLRAAFLKLQDASSLQSLDRRIDRYLPGYGDVGMRIGAYLLEAGELESAKDRFNLALSARRTLDTNEMLPYGRVSSARVSHDARYISFLLENGIISGDHYAAAANALRDLLPRFEEAAAGAMDLAEATLLNIADVYRQVVYLEKAPKLDVIINKAAVRNGLASLERASDIEIAVEDGFFHEDAFESVRRHLLRSAIWHNDDHQGAQYVSTDDTIGLVDPVLSRTKAELQAVVQEHRSDLRLEQVWAFKSMTGKGGSGISTHADYSGLNVNVWMTPDRYNLNASSGGMRIYDARRKPDADFSNYNGNADFVSREIEGAKSLVVPYRCNRFMLFDGAHFHGSDSVCFEDSYEGWRINLTFVFGNA